MKATYTATERVNGKWSTIDIPRETVASMIKMARLMSAATISRMGKCGVIIDWPHDIGTTIITRN